MKKVLTVAGSDSTGGAGVQADLKTFQEYGVFGFSSITSIVTMNPKKEWSHEITGIPLDILEKQLISVFASGKIDALKTGMMGNEENIQLISQFLIPNRIEQIVIDPVIVCKGRAQILQPENVEAIKKFLVPKALVVTPNLIEAGILSELGDLTSIEDMKKAAHAIHTQGASNVVVKGGSRLEGTQAIDVFYDGINYQVYKSTLFMTEFNHGAGCTFSAAITAGIGKGFAIDKAITRARDFVAAGIKHGVKINPYVGHVWHGAYQQAERRMGI